MKFIVRWLFRLFILLVVLAIAVLLLKDVLLKEMVANRVHRQTGLETRIERFESGLISPTITMENCRLYNPAEFGGAPLLHLAELHLEYDRMALFRRELHFRLVRINVAEINLVEDASGRSSIEIAQRILQPSPQEPSASSWDFRGIDTLNLTLGKLKRYSMKAPDRVETFNLGVQGQVLTGLNSRQDIMAALGRVLLNVGLRELTNRLAGPIRPTAIQPQLPSASSKPAPRPR